MYVVNYRLDPQGTVYSFTVRAASAEQALAIAGDRVEMMYERAITVWL